MFVCKVLEDFSENAKKTMTSIKGRGDTAACIYQLGKTRTKQQYVQTLQGGQETFKVH